VKSLGLPQVTRLVNVIAGLGGADVTPDTLRWALSQVRDDGVSLGPVYVPEAL
jgi:hypothetical protein